VSALSDTVRRLSQVSEHAYGNPYTALTWPASVNPEADWFSTPEYLSLYGTPEWDALAEESRKRLAFHEAANFYSLNIHGEKQLMAGLAERLYRKDMLEVADYLHHFLDEENKHSIYFGGFCTRYAKVYRSRQFAPVAADQPRDVADFLFFAKTMIFEEIVDDYNWTQARDERLHPVATFINRNHHIEEARHLIFGRELVTQLWRAQDWDEAIVADVRATLAQFLTSSWREYYNPDVYADAGLADPWGVAERAWDGGRDHRRAVSRKVLDFLTSTGVLLDEPDL
jgi:P-aminobenzoate N-oxygenase AurF